jgi:hypothetical protein
MTSIRRSLMLYFLVLLAVALGAVSILVYGNTERILQKEDATIRDLWLERHKANFQARNNDFDNALRRQALGLSRLAHEQYERRRRSLVVAPLALLNIGISPNALLNAPFLLDIRHRIPVEFQFNEEDLPREPDSQVTEYFQINNDSGASVWHSRSLGERSFTFDRKTFAALQPFESRFDDLDLTPDVSVRRVTLKAPLNWWPFRRDRRSGRSEGRPPTPPPNAPAILIQVAAEKTELSAKLAALQSDLDSELDKRRVEASETSC